MARPRRKPEEQPDPDRTEGIRRLAQDKLSQWLDPETLDELFKSVLAITKRGSGEVVCKACKQRQMAWFEIPDAKAVVAALSDIVTKIADVPKEQVQEQDRIVFERVIYMEPLADGDQPDSQV